MKTFREWLRESENKEETSEYKAYFKKMLAKYKVEDPSELSKEDKQKFFDEVDAGWKGEDEEPEINEAKQIVDKKQLEWIINLAKKARDLDELIDDLTLMKGLTK